MMTASIQLRRVAIATLLLLATAPPLALAGPHRALGTPPGGTSSPTGERSECGTLLFHADGSYENAYAWEYQGIQEPYFGAFAECYSGAGEVCSAVFDLTTVYDDHPDWTRMDVYLWDDDAGVPGSVILVVPDVDPGSVARWPELSRHAVPLPSNCVEGNWWVGQWSNWVLFVAQWFVGVDLDGPGGCSMTNIAPGLDLPTGWHDTSIVWEEEAALGIGAELNECDPVPTIDSTWGQVKILYQ